jgi:molecular chaperone GrpE (heat shock protein)
MKLESTANVWLRNFKTIFKLLRRNLTDNDVAELEPASSFDPYQHHIQDTVEDAQNADGTIVETVRVGYRWRGELLRKADVVVVKNVTDAARAGPDGAAAPGGLTSEH